MKFDHVYSNPPFGKIGVDIVNKITEEIPYNDISILGTTAMLSKHNDVLSLEYAYVRDYVLNPVTRCEWVGQLILLGHKGKCDVIHHSRYSGITKEEKPNEIRIPFSDLQSGHIGECTKVITTRNRNTSFILSLSDEDYEYIKEHWDDMNYIQRFWWLVEKGCYKKYVVQSDNQ